MTGDRSWVRTAPRAGGTLGRDAARPAAETRGHAELARGRRQLYDGPVGDARESLLLAASLLAADAPDAAEVARLSAADAAWASGDVLACLATLDGTDTADAVPGAAAPDTAPGETSAGQDGVSPLTRATTAPPPGPGTATHGGHGPAGAGLGPAGVGSGSAGVGSGSAGEGLRPAGTGCGSAGEGHGSAGVGLGPARAGHGSSGAGIGSAGGGPGPGWPRDPVVRDYRDGMRALLARRPGEAVGPLRRVLERAWADGRPERLLRAAAAALLLGDVHAARAAGARALAA
ncbi:hypothetical protein AB0N88_30165, partial [Streptomyces sp. NPDC093516]